MTCVLVISTSGRIYTEPAGGPGLTVYIACPLQRITCVRDLLPSSMPLLMSLLTTCCYETITWSFLAT